MKKENKKVQVEVYLKKFGCMLAFDNERHTFINEFVIGEKSTIES